MTNNLKILIQDYKLINAIFNSNIQTDEVQDIICDAVESIKDLIKNYKATTKEEAVDKLYFVRENIEDESLQDVITDSLIVVNQ